MCSCPSNHKSQQKKYQTRVVGKGMLPWVSANFLNPSEFTHNTLGKDYVAISNLERHRQQEKNEAFFICVITKDPAFLSETPEAAVLCVEGPGGFHFECLLGHSAEKLFLDTCCRQNDYTCFTGFQCCREVLRSTKMKSSILSLVVSLSCRKMPPSVDRPKWNRIYHSHCRCTLHCHISRKKLSCYKLPVQINVFQNLAVELLAVFIMQIYSSSCIKINL